MKWYRQLLAQAGFGNPELWVSALVPISAASLLAIVVSQATQVIAIGIAVLLLSLTLVIEFLKLRAKRRQRLIVQAWPEVVESIQSALQSSLTVSRAFEDLADFGPKIIRSAFSEVAKGLNRGVSLEKCLNWLKQDLATEPSDRTIETLKLLDQLGGHTSVEMLDELAKSLRDDQAFESELAAKQGWVVTTAKLGLIAPWAIVLLLSRRRENLGIYNSPTGLLVLCGGLAVCLIAYFMIQILGAELKAKRVFEDAK